MAYKKLFVINKLELKNLWDQERSVVFFGVRKGDLESLKNQYLSSCYHVGLSVSK
jgi:hypothetical protein